MPSSKNYIRDYKEEYENYHSKKSQKDKRSSRNKARRKLMKEGRVRLGDGMDVDHKDKNAKNNSKKNLRAMKRGENRSFKRNKNGGHA